MTYPAKKYRYHREDWTYPQPLQLSYFEHSETNPSYTDTDIFRDFLNSRKSPIRLSHKDIDVVLPRALKQFAATLEESAYLLELEDDWDDEGGTAVDFDTWKRTVEFLAGYANHLYKYQGFVLDPPEIEPGPGTSIDLTWRGESYRLLVNVPSNPEQPMGYYGDNRQGENSIKGKLKSGPVQPYFAIWLKEMRNPQA